MPFSNQEFFYNHLPARFRREDSDLFLKRFLQFSGETLDGWDRTFVEFSSQINPQTATEEFINWWLQVLFGWSYFPNKFTLAEKRNLYGNMARHFGRRGTARGIELWLLDFGAVAQVSTRSEFLDDSFFGEPGWEVQEPLIILVEIISLLDWGNYDLGAFDDSFIGDDFLTDGTSPRLTNEEIEILLRFVQPVSQEIFVIWRR